MKPSSLLTRLTTYGLSLLLLSTPALLPAQESASDPPPQQQTTIPEVSDDLTAGTDFERGPKVEAVIADMMLTETYAWREVEPRASEQTVAAQQTTPKQGGFKRWIKKRWYIPVIAAVLIGVSVADDSDSGETEDD